MPLAFEPVALDRQNDYLEFLGASPAKPSDYSMVNLWGWSLFYGLEWSFDNDLIWIRQTRPDVRYWAPVGNWGAIPDIHTRIQAELGQGTPMIRIPEDLLNRLVDKAGERLEVGESRDQWPKLHPECQALSQSRGKTHLVQR